MSHRQIALGAPINGPFANDLSALNQKHFELLQAWSLKMADHKRASKTARLECCAVWENRRVKTEKILLQQTMQQPNRLYDNQKSLIALPTINSTGN